MPSPLSEKPAALLQAIEALPDKGGVREFPTDDWLTNWNRSFDMSNAWSAVTLRHFERNGRLTIVRAGRRIVGVKMNGASPSAQKVEETEDKEATSRTERVLEALKRMADSRGRVPFDVDTLRGQLKLTPHDMVKSLFDLRNRGLVTFQKKRDGAHTKIERVQLKGDAIPQTVPLRDEQGTAVAIGTWTLCPDCNWGRQYHRVAVDRDDVLICPAHPKEGSPAAARLAAGVKSGADLPNREAVQKPPVRRELPSPVTYRCLACEPPQDFNDPVALKMHKEAKHAVTPAAVEAEPAGPFVSAPDDQAAEAAAIEAEPVATPVTKGHWRDEFPLLGELLGRHQALVRAAKALVEAGEAEMAKQMAEKADDSTVGPLAHELLSLLEQAGFEL